jgi:hypothetical protein
MKGTRPGNLTGMPEPIHHSASRPSWGRIAGSGPGHAGLRDVVHSVPPVNMLVELAGWVWCNGTKIEACIRKWELFQSRPLDKPWLR